MIAGLQRFGGNWTQQKLQVLEKYLQAYTRALHKQPFRLWYVDAFAGTGYREILGETDNQLALAGFDSDAQRFLDGSARVALQASPPFDHYLFIERDPAKCEQLCQLAGEFKEVADRIRCVQGDCNQILLEFCVSFDVRSCRAVLFLDPFGMNVDWSTMEAVARTRAIDVWALFPLGSAVNRLLMRDGKKIPDAWAARLDSIFGTHAWFDRFYTRKTSTDLFENAHETAEKTGNLESIADFYVERLSGIFAAVAKNPAMMYNSRSNPVFMFCFAVGNPSPKAQGLAMKIAGDILKKV